MSTNRLASSPSRNSSITTLRAPARRRSPCHRAFGLLSREGHRHALAGGQAVGLDHHRQRGNPRGARPAPVAARAADIAGGRDARSRAHKSLVKPLEPSSCAGTLFGPNTASPMVRRLSPGRRPAAPRARSPRSRSNGAGRNRSLARWSLDRDVARLACSAIPGFARRGVELVRAAAIARASRRAHVRGHRTPTTGHSWPTPFPDTPCAARSRGWCRATTRLRFR